MQIQIFQYTKGSADGTIAQKRGNQTMSDIYEEEEKKEEPAAPAGPTTEELLAEIRDLLRDKGQDAV